MTRTFVPAAVCAAALLACPRPAAAQTTIYNSNGFEPGTFNLGNMTAEGFLGLPTPNAAQVQTGTVFAGSQALRIAGPGLATNPSFGDVNFWYRPYTQAAAVNPVALGTPHVQVSGRVRMSGASPLLSDISFAGFHLEAYFGPGANDTQMVSPVYMSATGAFTVLTTDGQDLHSTQTFAREQWHSVVADFDFAAQTFRVFVNDELLDFGGTTVVPFRNTFGTSQSIFEIGFEATWSQFMGPTSNNFFVDDYHVTRSAVPYAPVPEPAACLAVAGVALAGVRRWRRVRAAVPTP